MKILITGATGFLGSILARRLCGREDVHVFVRERSDRWRLRDISGRLHFHEADLLDPATVEGAVKEIKPDGIFHLAAHGGFSDQKDKESIIRSNFDGTVNLLQACERTGFGFFVNAGSSSEYGTKDSPMKESDDPHPLGHYAVSKAAATLYCRSEAELKRLPVVTLRVFSPFGPWDGPKRMIPYVIKSFLRGSEPKLSSPDFVRDYIYAEDVAEAFIRAAEKPLRPGSVINIGSGRQVSVGEVVSIVGEMVGNGIRPSWGAIPPARPEPSSWVADISKAREELGWSPAVSLQDGLKNTVEWIRGHLDLYP